MALIVQKYGGTSMGTPERILNVARRVKRWHDHGHKVVVVVSAMSGETNRLLALAKAITETPDPRELDQMVSTGEQVTISMLAMALNSIGVEAKSIPDVKSVLKLTVHLLRRVLSRLTQMS